VCGAAYLFSESGHKYIAGFIQKKLNEYSEIKLTVSDFKLSSRDVFIKISAEDGSYAELNATHSIISQGLDGRYMLNVLDVANFEKIVGTKLNGSVVAVGDISFENNLIASIGVIDIVNGRIDYKLSQPISDQITLDVNSTPLQIKEILHFANMPQVASGEVVLDVNMSADVEKQIDGNAAITIQNGLLYKAALAKELNTTIPKDVSFKGVINSVAKNTEITTDADIDSELLKVTLNKFIYDLKDKSMDGAFKLIVSSIELPDINIYKPFEVEGTIKDNGKESKADINTNIFDATTNVVVSLEELKPKSVALVSQNMSIASIVKTLKNDGIAGGAIDIKSDFTLENSVIKNGNAVVGIKKGMLYKNALAKKGTTIPKDVTFEGAIEASAKDEVVTTDAKINSELANLVINKFVYDMQKKSMNGAFNLNVSTIELPDINIYKPFKVSGTIKEQKADISTDIFESDTKATILLDDLKPKDVNLDAKNISIAGIVKTLKKDGIATGSIDIKSDAKLDKGEMKSGNAAITIQNGLLYKAALAKELNTTIPKDVSFKGVINSVAKNTEITTDADIDSELLKVTLNKFIYDLKDKSMDGAFKLIVSSIELPDINIYKPFEVEGTIKDNGKESKADINTNIFDATTNVVVSLEEFAPKNAAFDVKNLSIENIETFLKQPSYAKGVLHAKGDIAGLKSNDISGDISLDSTNIVIPIKTQKELMGLKDAKEDITVSLKSDTDIKNGVATSSLNIDSSVADIVSKSITYDIKKDDLNADFDIIVQDLKKIAFITGKELAGSIKINNKVEKKGETLTYNAHTDTLGGAININLKDKILKVDANSVQAQELGKMLQLGNLLKGGVFNLDADLNIATKDNEELMRVIDGSFVFKGDGFTLNGYNIDKIVDNLKDSQSVNLMDIGAFVVAGPLGIAATKGSNLGGTALGSMGGETIIKEMLIDSDIKNGTAYLKDAAFSTRTNLMAFKGDVRLWDYGLNDFWIAVMDKHGCTEFKQKIGGTLDNPKIQATEASFEVVKNVVKSVGSLFGDTIGKAVDALGGGDGEKKCDRFYNGSVKYPK